MDGLAHVVRAGARDALGVRAAVQEERWRRLRLERARAGERVVRPNCKRCDGSGVVWTGSYTCYDDDGNPLGHAEYEDCSCTEPPPKEGTDR